MLFQPKRVGLSSSAGQTSPIPTSRVLAKRSFTYGAMLCAVAASATIQASNWPNYVVYPVAKIGSERNFALALNNYSEIAGNTKTSSTESVGLIGGAALPSVPAGLPPSASFMSFLGINDSKEAVGYANVGGYPQALFYQNGVTKSLFTPNHSNPGSESLAVNNSGQILGWAYKIDDDSREHVSMFRFDPATNSTFEWADTYAGGINEQGVIAASPDDYELNQTPELQLMIDDLTSDDYNYFPPAPYGRVFPAGVSGGNADPSQDPVAVVGDWETPTENGTGTKRDGFLFEQFSQFWYPMPDPSGHNYETDPVAIDPSGQHAVGYAIDIHGNHYAVGWANTGNHMTWASSELHDVFGNPSGWTFTDATGINEYGAISGYGVLNGVPTSFVAVPAVFYRFTVPVLSVVGGQSARAQLQMTVPIGTSLTFRGASSSGVATMPRTVTAINEEPVSLTIQTQAVTRETRVQLTLSLGGISQSVNMVVLPSITSR
jgi:hypothetical protein